MSDNKETPKAIFKAVTPDGHTYQVFDDGTAEGFPDGTMAAEDAKGSNPAFRPGQPILFSYVSKPLDETPTGLQYERQRQLL